MSDAHCGIALSSCGMLRCWRTPINVVKTPHSRCVTSQAGKNSATLLQSRQRWYQRQVAAKTLFPVDLLPLAQRVPGHVASFQSSSALTSRSDATATNFADAAARATVDATAEAFLSCCRSSLCDADVLFAIYAQLAAEQQCTILCQGMTSEEHGIEKAFFLRCSRESLRNPTFSPAHWTRVLTSLRDCSSIAVGCLPLTEILPKVLQRGVAAFESTDEARFFVSQALHLLERDNTTPRAAVVACLEACGLSFEACAYASTSASFVPCAGCGCCGNDELDGLGYGPLLHSMCALPQPPVKWLSRVRAAMPPVLQRYATLTLLRSAVIRSGGVAGVDAALWRPFTASLMSPLELVSALHFVLNEGNAFTARMLLEHCHTRHQLLTLMRYTRSAGLPSTFQALEKFMALDGSGGERVVVHLRLTSRTQRTRLALHFDAQPGGAVVASARRSARTVDTAEEMDAAEVPWLSLSALDRGYLNQYLRDALPRGVVARGERSLSQLLSAIPSSAVEHVASSLPTMHRDALSWWVALYLHGGNVDGAFAVLAVIALRGCLPNMEVLVELLEATQDSTESFVRAVSVVRQDFATVADTVLRAFVERTAAQMSGAGAANAGATAQAVHTLKALAVMGLPQLSARCLHDMAAANSPDTIHAIIGLAQALCSSRGGAAVAIPLEVAAMRGLAMAGVQLRYRVGVTAIAVGEDGTFTGWWASACAPRRSLTHLAYTSSEASLWPWVKAEALSTASTLPQRELHWAVRVVALGSQDGRETAAFWHTVKDKLALPPSDDVEVERLPRRRRRTSFEARSITYTLACVYAVCVADSQWQLAKSVLRSAGPSLPPLLSALEATHTARLREQEKSTKHIVSSRISEGDAARKRRAKTAGVHMHKRRAKHGQRGGTVLSSLPPSLQRLVKLSSSMSSRNSVADLLAARTTRKKVKKHR